MNYIKKIFIKFILKLDEINIIKLKDYLFIKYKYYAKTELKLNLKNPQSFNEKLQWLKLYDRNPEYTKMVDKYEVKKYISNIIGKDYIIPTLGIYNYFDEIDFDKLPNQFVLKCTHDSGGIVICKDKNNLDIKQVKKKINKSLKKNYYYSGREWPYKNVKPRIIIEKYMEDKETEDLKDYKFFCFNGVPKLMFIATDRGKHETKFNFYDLNFNKLNIKQHYPNDKRKIIKPKNFDRMIELSKLLSKNIPHVRVDWYEINGKLYFGELTFYHFSGFEAFEPEEWNYKLGEMLKLPDKKISDKNEK